MLFLNKNTFDLMWWKQTQPLCWNGALYSSEAYSQIDTFPNRNSSYTLPWSEVPSISNELGSTIASNGFSRLIDYWGKLHFALMYSWMTFVRFRRNVLHLSMCLTTIFCFLHDMHWDKAMGTHVLKKDCLRRANMGVLGVLFTALHSVEWIKSHDRGRQIQK